MHMLLLMLGMSRRGVQLAKNDFGLVFGSVWQKTVVFGSVSVLLN